MVIDILPSIFEQHRIEREEGKHIRDWVLSLPGGQKLWEERQMGGVVLPPVAYLSPDLGRDASAARLLGDNQISVPTSERNRLYFTCYSSYATELDCNPVTYDIHISYAGSASCSCLDFRKNGGACKHL